MANVVLDMECYGFKDNSMLKGPRNQYVCYEGTGENKLMVIFKEKTQFMQPGQREFLEKVLKSTGHGLESAIAINMARSEINSFTAFNKIFLVNSIIFFDIKPVEVGLNVQMEKNKVCHFNNQNILFTDALNDLQEKAQLKKPLWKALQQMFAIDN